MSSHPLIAVIGVNGAGKSTFINVASGRNDLGEGHGIEACTQDITPKSVLVDNAWVNLIDTPGWDDTYRTDTDILTLIGDYVGRTFSAGQLLQGVILLHKGLNHQSFGILWSKAVLSQQARPFQLQTELVGNGYYLSTTSVGIQLITDIKAMIFRDTSRITELEEDLRRTAADNAAMRARLEGDLNDLIEKLKKAEDDIERLKQRRRCVIL
ncbi:unnamed protein product [Alternaria alternata]